VKEKVDRKGNRKARIPLGIQQLKLNFPQKEGFKNRIVCDRQGRLAQAQAGGYEFVSKSELAAADERYVASTDVTEGLSSYVSQVVGTHPDGTPMLGYLMRIPEEDYNEDQDEKMAKIEAGEASMRRGENDGQAPGVDGRYVPRAGIKIQHEVK
jgi:hypothetical protein